MQGWPCALVARAARTHLDLLRVAALARWQRRMAVALKPDGWSSCGTDGSTRPSGSSGWPSRFPATRRVRSPADEATAKALKKRTLTNLIQRPAAVAGRCPRRPLDAAVAAAYGWLADISDDAVLRELLALNDGLDGSR